MLPSQLIRKFSTFRPSTPFADMLKNEFNIDVPPATPKFQVEYLYKYCLQEKANGTPDSEVITAAAAKVKIFMEKFPWVSMKYDQQHGVIQDESLPSYVMRSTSPAKRKRAPTEIVDGTIEFYTTKNIFQLYMGGKSVVTGTTLESLKKNAEKRGFTIFGEIYTFANGVASKYEA